MTEPRIKIKETKDLIDFDPEGCEGRLSDVIHEQKKLLAQLEKFLSDGWESIVYDYFDSFYYLERERDESDEEYNTRIQKIEAETKENAAKLAAKKEERRKLYEELKAEFSTEK